MIIQKKLQFPDKYTENQIHKVAMKTMIFPPDQRPNLMAYSLKGPNDSEVQGINCAIVELDKDILIVHTAVSLPLRGFIQFKDEEIEYIKKDEAQIDDHF